MSFFKKLFSKDEAAETAAGPKVKSPKLLRKERNQGNTYEVYKGDDVESAKEFLMGRFRLRSGILRDDPRDERLAIPP